MCRIRQKRWWGLRGLLKAVRPFKSALPSRPAWRVLGGQTLLVDVKPAARKVQ